MILKRDQVFKKKSIMNYGKANNKYYGKIYPSV